MGKRRKPKTPVQAATKSQVQTLEEAKSIAERK